MTENPSSRRLVDDATLAMSSVVANNTMNRDRLLTGAGSYARELGFDPLKWLTARPPPQAWLDLCCGAGRALGEAAATLLDAGRLADIHLTGVDLVDHFDPRAPPDAELICAPLHDWQPGRADDLIMCVHGLHYVGDKLGAIERAASWWTTDGRRVASFDASSVQGGRANPSGDLVNCSASPGSTTTRAVSCWDAQGAGRVSSACATSVRTTALGRTTPASPPSTRTTPAEPSCSGSGRLVLCPGVGARVSARGGEGEPLTEVGPADEVLVGVGDRDARMSDGDQGGVTDRG